MNDNRKKQRQEKGRPIVLIIVLCFIASLVALTAICISVFKPSVSVTPPFDGTIPGVNGTDDDSSTSKTEETSGTYTRKDGYYTFLICGTDVVSRNTDVMMLVSLDTVNDEINILQVPRDTFINPSTSGYNVTRINSIYTSAYASAPYTGKTRQKIAMDKLCTTLEASLCVTIDRYMLIDIDAFVGIIDAIGGVDFYVPMDMDYEDPEQNLYIHLKEGMQHLDGNAAMQFVRYRTGYVSGDIGRVEARADFLKAVYNKVRENLSVSVVIDIAKQLFDSFTTDASIDDMVFFANAVYGINSDNINIATISGSAVMNPQTGVWSYYALNKNKALADINRYMNVFKESISYSIFDKNAIFTDDPDGANPYISEYYYS